MMQSYLFSEVSQWIDCEANISKDVHFSHLITDSRSVSDPQTSMFIAINGKNHNGHDYIESLYQQGIRCFLVEKDFQISEQLTEANFLKVNNALAALQQLVAFKRKKYNCPIIGITGSNGKTIVKEWISQMIGKSKVVVRSPKSYNSQIGVPLSVWQLNESCEVGVFEAGISLPGEMEKIASVIIPSIGVLTNIGAAHQKNFSSKAHKLKEKLNLFKDAQTIVYRADVDFIQNEIQQLYSGKNLFSWGKDKGCTIQIVSESLGANKASYTIQYLGKEDVLHFPFSDQASLENAMHAVACMLLLGYDISYINKSLKGLVPVAMRMELKEGINNCIIINDAYNSDLSSLAISLDFLVQQSKQRTSKRTLILSDIYQSGIEDDELCRQVNDMLMQKGIDKLIGVGSVLRTNANLFEIESSFFSSTDELLEKLSSQTIKDEAILIKGSRNFEFEKVTELLEKKHHQTSLEINLNALVDNLNYYRSKLNEGTKLLAMVKAFSYGSGSFEIANVLQHQKVDYLGVAFADEGVELRKAGISLPIIVMNPEAKSFPMMLAYKLEPEIYGFNELEQFVHILSQEGITEYPVHIKFDTGMNRLGFVEAEVPEIIQRLANAPEIRVKSVFSHLVGSDDAQFDDFTKNQILKFKEFTNKLKEALGYDFIKHILNSAGVLRFPDAQFDMVRLGIGMYGIGAVDQHKLRVVTRFRSYISQLKRVKANETVGYSRKGKLAYDAEIAVVPVGYADGLNRRLGNGVGQLMVNGQLAPILGNICMDMCMIDVTGLQTKEGDEVEIFGADNSVMDLAASLGTIPYEVFTSISRRVKRIYYYE